MKYGFVNAKVHINQYITKTFCDILFSIRALIPPSTTHYMPFLTLFSPAFKRHAQHPCAEKHAICHAICTTLPTNSAAFTLQSMRFCMGVFSELVAHSEGLQGLFLKFGDHSEGLRGLFSKFDDHSEGL